MFIIIDICQYMLICDAHWTIEYYRDQGSLTVAETAEAKEVPSSSRKSLWYCFGTDGTGIPLDRFSGELLF
jgi:hypothetical protein